MPGDTHRNLNVNSDYSGQTFKHILVPVWLLTYNYGPRTFQVVINGFTGAIAGQYPEELGENPAGRAGRTGGDRPFRTTGRTMINILKVEADANGVGRNGTANLQSNATGSCAKSSILPCPKSWLSQLAVAATIG